MVIVSVECRGEFDEESWPENFAQEKLDKRT